MVMTLRKLSMRRSRGWLIGGAVAFGVALMLSGCIVEPAPGFGYREHWHGSHQWR
jgi:hypothetical protein